METLYRKVILNIVDRCFHMYASDYRKEAKEYAIEMLEEIPDTSHQLEKLEAEKKELLEALEKCNNELYFYSGQTDFVKENQSLIQKHKQ